MQYWHRAGTLSFLKNMLPFTEQRYVQIRLFVKVQTPSKVFRFVLII